MATTLVIIDGYRGLIYDVIDCVLLIPTSYTIHDWCNPSRQQCPSCKEYGSDNYCYTRFTDRTMVQKSCSYVTTHYGDIYVDEILEPNIDQNIFSSSFGY